MLQVVYDIGYMLYPLRRKQKAIMISFLKWAILGLFFIYFGLPKQATQILQQINVKKCPSSILCRDSNSQTSDYESPPLTTRQGLPPSK